MLDSVLRKDLVELIGSNFNADQINALGQYVSGNFDLHKLRGMDRHITVPALDAAKTLVTFAEDRKRIDGLLEILIETDDERLEGRRVSVTGLEAFLARMARSGLIYDFDKRRVRRSEKDAAVAANWGSFRDGRIYPVTIAGIDIVGNSDLVREYGMKTMERVYYRFWNFLARRLAGYDGRTWSWAGDGGILAFAFKGSETRAVQWALEVQATLPIFNTGPDNPIDGSLSARIGLDYGKVRFRQDTGRIISDTINFASHLEKQATEPGYVSISDAVHSRLAPRLAGLFEPTGSLEGRDVFSAGPPAVSPPLESKAG